MEILYSYMIAAPVILVYVTILFLIALIIKDNSIADTAWGLGFIIAAVSVMLYQGAFGVRNILVTALVIVWGTRLSLRIFRRNRGRGEDWRYRRWREEWGRMFYPRSYLQVFILQGAILLVNSAPVFIVNSYQATTWAWTDSVGLCVWLIGLYFEAVGDWQLDKFVREPVNRGIIIQQGLWRYSRHPNYFGEITMWWGIFIIALGSPYGIFGIIGPIIISLMIIFVSGIPLAEQAMERKPGFTEYKRRTSVLVPWLPRK
jgi:steroid 5-alpha reductase family enzyme